MNKVIKYKNDYLKLKKEINSKKYTKKFLEEYVLEMKIVKANAESIIKLCEVISLPFAFAVLGGIISLVGYKNLLLVIFALFGFMFLTVIINIWIIRSINVSLVFINSIIDLCEQHLNKN